MPTLGSKIRYFRKRAGLSQMELEFETGASAGSISRIENDEVNPTKETLTQITKVLTLTAREASYLSGVMSIPPTKDEIDKAKNSIAPYFNKKGVLAYMLDERYRLWAVSKDFIKMLGLSDRVLEGIIGQSVVRLVIDESLGIKKLLVGKQYETTLNNLLLRMHKEMGFMEDDEVYKDTVAYIKNDPVGNNLWSKITSSPGEDFYYELERREVTFKVLGIDVKMTYSIEPLVYNERFDVIEYTPTNLVFKILSKL